MPAWDFATWLVLAGRGYGKTRVGAETCRQWIKDGYNHVNLIAPTADDLRDVMVEGESGILAVCPKGERPVYRVSKRRLEWPNGARSLLFSAQEPDRLRGKQHAKLWADEPACVTADTLVETEEGPRTIDSVKVNDRVWTRSGLRRVLASWMSSPSAPVLELSLLDGRRLVGTENHPVFIHGEGFIPLKDVRSGDMIISWEQSKASYGEVGDGGSTVGISATGAGRCCTAQFTAKRTAQSRQVTTYITSTSIRQTTRRKISKRSPGASICANTRQRAASEARKIGPPGPAPHGSARNRISWSAGNALVHFPRLERALSFVPRNAMRHSADECIQKKEESINLDTFRDLDSAGSALSASAYSAVASSQRLIRELSAAQEAVGLRIVKSVSRLERCQAVFNLSVEEGEEYFANGILVHNSWQYDIDAWDQAQFGLRLGNNPQTVATTTPRPTKLIRSLLEASKG
ncbi:MAG: terminase large subunit domain-containing protein, partial [Gammaproteobacteria bacterium]